ncbi:MULTISPECIES: hypothetical protein [unclassified Rhizobium]|uniref:hypothetical protein n=1 Tax=unclassified Rhizobium TaxID=2613769 RepID=UPI00138F2B59|nr:MULTISPECIES: hypothetical protein [unclassified Rhizobium]
MIDDSGKTTITTSTGASALNFVGIRYMSNFLRIMSNRLSSIRHDEAVRDLPFAALIYLRMSGNSPSRPLPDGPIGNHAIGPFF